MQYSKYSLNIPTISDEFNEKLEAELKEEEMAIGIDSMKAGKTAGPDGLPIDFFKNVLCNVLAKRLQQTLPSVVYRDQNGLIVGRQGYLNVL